MTVRTPAALIVGPSWVGDMVMAQSLFIVLEQSRPGLQLDVLAPPWSRPLLARMPQVRRALDLPFAHGEVALGERRSLGRRLRAHAYEQAIVLPNSLKSALVPWFARIPRRTGWRGEMRYGLLNDLRVLDKQAMPLMVQRFAALGVDSGAPLRESIPAPRLRTDPVMVALCQSKYQVSSQGPVLALCPGAEFGAAKRWPPEYFSELAQRYLQRGWQVMLLGSEKDRVETSQIVRSCGEDPGCLNLAGRTTLAEAVDLLAIATAVVSNDSGLMHIAAALGRPLVAIYGATSPEFTPPRGTRAALQVSDIECAPCFQRECPFGHHRCMRDMPASMVAARLDALLVETT